MSEYGALAAHYDMLNGEVPYIRLAKYLIRHFERHGLPVRTVLDLACGTGTVTWALADAGYEMIGIDSSPDMLSVCASKAAKHGGQAPLLLCQDMAELDLYGTVDAAVCTLDSANYVTDPRRLRRAFERVRLFLNPGGLFIFDVNTESKLASRHGTSFVSESADGNVFCACRTEYSAGKRMARYDISVFSRSPSGVYSRYDERHTQRIYSAAELEEMLEGAGFGEVRAYGDMVMRPPKESEERIFYRAVKTI